jgi:hypothetical protein
MLATACAGVALVAIATSANAAQCRSAIDETGEAVILCGAAAYYAEDAYDNDELESLDYEVEEDGALFVDVEDCEPGSFWMLETDEVEIPMACR